MPLVLKQDVNTTLPLFRERHSEGKMTGVQKEKEKKNLLEDSHPSYNTLNYEGISFLSLCL